MKGSQQSIPAVSIPHGISRTFLHVVRPGGGSGLRYPWAFDGFVIPFTAILLPLNDTFIGKDDNFMTNFVKGSQK